jgi:hypothetical protein
MCVLGSNSVQVILFLVHAAAIFLLHIMRRNAVPKFCIPGTFLAIHQYMAEQKAAIPPHKFVCSPSWYYRL